MPTDEMSIDTESYYRKYAPMVLRRCRRLLRDERDAADAMQDTFVKLWRNRARLRDQAPSSLLYRMATNVCLNWIRDGRAHAHEGDEALAAIAHHDDLGARFEFASTLRHIFDAEPASTRVMATLLYVDEMTLEEVAAQVGLSVSAVRKRMRTLQLKLERDRP